VVPLLRRHIIIPQPLIHFNILPQLFNLLLVPGNDLLTEVAPFSQLLFDLPMVKQVLLQLLYDDLHLVILEHLVLRLLRLIL
jgi:hypothetical protein